MPIDAAAAAAAAGQQGRKLVRAAEFFQQLRAVCGVALTAEEEGVLVAAASAGIGIGTDGRHVSGSIEGPPDSDEDGPLLHYDRVCSLLRGDPEPRPEPEPEPEPEVAAPGVELLRQNSAEERARREAATAALAAELITVAETERELAAVQAHLQERERAQQQQEHQEERTEVVVDTWAGWDAAVAAGDAQRPPVLYVQRADGSSARGRVLKVDGHRVRVEWEDEGGKKQWTTKRDLATIRVGLGGGPRSPPPHPPPGL